MDTLFDIGTITNFKVLLLSIVIEAMPFVLSSVLVSAIINNFASENMIRKIIPQNRILSIVPAALVGILFPVCDCGMVPIVRRLVAKGVPLHTAVSFMLAAPIINPVVTAATAFAFRLNENMVYFRLSTAFLVACLTGWLIGLLFQDDELKQNRSKHHHSCGGCGHTLEENLADVPFSVKLLRTLHDASNEFFEMGKYLVLGAMLAALAQLTIPRSLLLTVGQHSFSSIGIMMLFAFCISVCSSADAFIAASFGTSFTAGALIAFMVFGPMIDLKNIFMLGHAFRLRFVISLTCIVAVLCATLTYLINLL